MLRSVNYWRHSVEYPHYPIAYCLPPFEILFTNILDLFNIWVELAWTLASFQAIELMDQPVPKTLDIFVCQTSENKVFFTKRSIL